MSSPQVGNPRVGVSATCPVTVFGIYYLPQAPCCTQAKLLLCGEVKLHHKNPTKFMILVHVRDVKRFFSVFLVTFLPSSKI